MAQLSDSERYQLMADMCRVAESFQWGEEDYFAFCDDGTTLQVNQLLLQSCRTHPDWSQLEQRYSSMSNCGIWVPDEESEWEVA